LEKTAYLVVGTVCAGLMHTLYIRGTQ